MRCVDCGENPYEYYRVFDATRREARIDPNVHCCLACLERRLGCPLTIADFPLAPVNRPQYATVGRLREV